MAKCETPLRNLLRMTLDDHMINNTAIFRCRHLMITNQQRYRLSQFRTWRLVGTNISRDMLRQSSGQTGKTLLCHLSGQGTTFFPSAGTHLPNHLISLTNSRLRHWSFSNGRSQFTLFRGHKPQRSVYLKRAEVLVECIHSSTPCVPSYKTFPSVRSVRQEVIIKNGLQKKRH